VLCILKIFMLHCLDFCSDDKCIAADTGCFKCGEEGHMSRDCPGAGTRPQGRGRNFMLLLCYVISGHL